MDALGLSKASADLDAFFPPKLVRVMKRTADAKSIPLASLATTMLLLAATFSPSSWANGVGGHIEPLILHLKAMGDSGINKSGGTKLFDYLFKMVRNALVSLSADAATCLEEGIHIDRQSIPELDRTATQAALIKENSAHRNLTASFDEYATMKRQATNGTGGGASESGYQHTLTSYNGPNKITNVLKGSTDTLAVPRYNTCANIQPALAVSEFGASTMLLELGLTSRNLWLQLEANFSPNEIRKPITKDEQSLLEYALAIATRSCVASGQWVAREDADELESKFVGKGNGPLLAQEESALMFETNCFESSGFGVQGVEWMDKLASTRKLNRTGCFERMKAANKGEDAAGRYSETYEFTPEDDGSKAKLPTDFLEAGIEKLRVFSASDGSEASKAMERFVLQHQKTLASRKPETPLKKLEGKTCGQFFRLVGISQTIETAVSDVDGILGDGALGNLSSMKKFILAVVKQENSENTATVDSYVSWGTGSELESRLPSSSFEEISEQAVSYSINLIQTSLEVAGSLIGSTNNSSPSPTVRSSEFISSHSGIAASLGADISGAGPSSMSEGSRQYSRAEEMIRAACKKRFITANLLSIVSDFRLRASNRGNNKCPAEFPLLKDVQDSGLVAVVIHGTPASKKIILKKAPIDTLTVSQKEKLAAVLTTYGVTMDEYRAGVMVGTNDVQLSPSDNYPGLLPYGLNKSDIPRLLQDLPVEIQQEAALTPPAPADNDSSSSSSNGKIASLTLKKKHPPVATQLRKPQTHGNMDDASEDSGDASGDEQNTDPSALAPAKSASSSSCSSAGKGQVSTQVRKASSKVGRMKDDADDEASDDDDDDDNSEDSGDASGDGHKENTYPSALAPAKSASSSSCSSAGKGQVSTQVRKASSEVGHLEDDDDDEASDDDDDYDNSEDSGDELKKSAAKKPRA